MHRSKHRAALAASFVVTGSALLVACAGDPQAKTPEYSHNPPMPHSAEPPATASGTATTSSPPTDANLKPAPATGGTVSKTADGSCVWMEDVKCPPPEVATCNPPPPMPVKCP